MHARAGDKEPLMCMSFGRPAPSMFTTTPALTIETDYDKQLKKNYEKITWKAIEVTISGKKYAFRPSKKGSRTGDVYDLESYNRAVKLGGEAILVGKILIDPKSKKIKFNLI